MHYISVDFLDEINAQLTQIETSDSRISGRVEVYVCKSMGHHKRLYKELERQYKELHSEELDLAALSSAEPGEDEPFGSMKDSNSRKTLFYLISVLNMAFPDYDFSSLKSRHFKRHQLPDIVHHVNSCLPSDSVPSIGSTIIGSVGGSGSSDGSVNDIERLKRRLWFAIEDSIGPRSLDNIMSLPQESADGKVDNNTVNYKRPRRDSYVATTAPLSALSEWQESDIEIYSYQPDNATGAGDPYEDDEIYDDDRASSVSISSASAPVIGPSRGTVWRFFYFFYNRRVKRVLFFSMKADVVTTSDIATDSGVHHSLNPSEQVSEAGDSEISPLASPIGHAAAVVDLTKLKADPIIYGHDIRILGGTGGGRSLKRSLTNDSSSS